MVDFKCGCRCLRLDLCHMEGEKEKKVPMGTRSQLVWVPVALHNP